MRKLTDTLIEKMSREEMSTEEIQDWFMDNPINKDSPMDDIVAGLIYNAGQKYGLNTGSEVFKNILKGL